MIKCSIVGQSNSFMKGGYASFLETSDPNINVVRKGCLGGSPSIIAPFILSDDFFSDCDFCIIDLALVDAASTTHLAYFFGSITRWIEWTCHKARKNNCEPILLAIPLSFYALTDSSVMRLYTEVAKSLHVRIFDVRELLSQLSNGDEDNVKRLYMDPVHPNEHCSRLISDVLVAFMKQKNTLEVTHELVSYAFPVLSKVNLADCSEAKYTTVAYSNILFSFNGLRISEQDEIVVNAGEGSRLLAMMVNASACHRNVLIQGSRQVVKSLNLQPYSSSTFESRLVPLASPMPARNGQFSLRIADSAEPISERSMREAERFNDNLAFVEISDLLFETGLNVVTYQASIPHTVDLSIFSITRDGINPAS